jgi:ATP-dependent DNA helicase RecQ
MNNFTYFQETILNTCVDIHLPENIHPLYKRFLESYQINFEDRSQLDIAILLRQILLLETSLRSNNIAKLEVPSNNQWPSTQEWGNVGIIATQINSSWQISAEWWSPNWLEGSNKKPVDYCATSEINKRDEINFPSNAKDIFLEQCGEQYVKYTSVDQQKAVRSVLSLERGKTIAISLPTGEGKSLIFKLINDVGFFDTKNRGLTLVIVPTITLALDQEQGIQAEKNNKEPYAYIGQRNEQNKLLKEKIKNGEQDICFVSPEAAYGPLRQALLTSARNGSIRAIVIDEAHIIEEWGMDFRHEFQLFSGLWRQMLEISPKTNQFRTILLSATYTQESIYLIKTLFSSKNTFSLYAATKLRPEIDFWIAKTTNNNDVRENRVIESLFHLPRPLILYTTKVNDAIKFEKSLRVHGFQNLAIVHGRTSSTERNRVINQWKSGHLDVVVATSAFGLGIDYPHTRSIVHACVPETLNRFYQEVGRGGRDGKCSISLILPTFEDIRSAKGMNNKIIIGDEKGFNRWDAMFENKPKRDNGSKNYTINLTTPPSHGMDYDSKKNNMQNAQVISLMARANLIQLVGFPKVYTENLDDYSNYLNLRIINENHRVQEVWSEFISPIRSNSIQSNKLSFNLLMKFLKQDICPVETFKELYEIKLDEKIYEISTLCSSCCLCRNDSLAKKYIAAPLKRTYSINNNDINIINRICDSPSVLIQYTEQSLVERSFKRSFFKVIKNLVINGIQNFIFIGNSKNLFFTDKIIKKINDLPIFIEHIDSLRKIVLAKKNLPIGGYVIFIGLDVDIDKNIVALLKKKNNIVFMREDVRDPITYGRMLSDVYQYDILKLNEFIKKVGI